MEKSLSWFSVLFVISVTESFSGLSGSWKLKTAKKVSPSGRHGKNILRGSACADFPFPPQHSQQALSSISIKAIFSLARSSPVTIGSLLALVQNAWAAGSA
jgi:hypothetical protein